MLANHPHSSTPVSEYRDAVTPSPDHENTLRSTDDAARPDAAVSGTSRRKDEKGARRRDGGRVVPRERSPVDVGRGRHTARRSFLAPARVAPCPRRVPRKRRARSIRLHRHRHLRDLPGGVHPPDGSELPAPGSARLPRVGTVQSRASPTRRIEPDELPALDAVLLSHLHGDHFDRVSRGPPGPHDSRALDAARRTTSRPVGLRLPCPVHLGPAHAGEGRRDSWW